MAHSDDFRWFGPPDMIKEWDLLVLTFNKHRYEVTVATNKSADSCYSIFCLYYGENREACSKTHDTKVGP